MCGRPCKLNRRHCWPPKIINQGRDFWWSHLNLLSWVTESHQLLPREICSHRFWTIFDSWEQCALPRAPDRRHRWQPKIINEGETEKRNRFRYFSGPRGVLNNITYRIYTPDPVVRIVFVPTKKEWPKIQHNRMNDPCGCTVQWKESNSKLS